MKALIAAIIIFGLSGVAHVAGASATAQDQMTACSLKADLFTSAAQMRDQGQRPEDTSKVLGSYKGKFVSSQDFKSVINAVYFDQRFAQAGGMPLKRQMLDECLNGPKPAWKPLQ